MKPVGAASLGILWVALVTMVAACNAHPCSGCTVTVLYPHDAVVQFTDVAPPGSNCTVATLPPPLGCPNRGTCCTSALQCCGDPADQGGPRVTCIQGRCDVCIAARSACRSSDECCTGYCANGLCTLAGAAVPCPGSDHLHADAPNPSCFSGLCVQDHCACSLGGQGCADASDCCQGTCTSGTCTCTPRGAACDSDQTCCSGRCVAGHCGCGTNTRCAADADCCSGACGHDVTGLSTCVVPCPTTCLVIGDCPPGGSCRAGHCCIPTGDSSAARSGECSVDLPCCVTSTSPYSSTCQCAPLAAPCTDPTDCCSGACVGGVCGCTSTGGACATNAACCSSTCTGGACTCTAMGGTCASNGDCCSRSCIHGACVCAHAAAACTANRDCCSGACVGGVCACAAVGDVCSADALCCSGACQAGRCVCQRVGGACADGSTCCSGTCSDAVCTCAASGQTCGTGADCCSGACAGGRCLCAAAGAICASDALCCTGHCTGGRCGP